VEHVVTQEQDVLEVLPTPTDEDVVSTVSGVMLQQ